MENKHPRLKTVPNHFRVRTLQYVTAVIAAAPCLASARQVNLAQDTGVKLAECAATEHGSGLYITPDCFDPDYSDAIIDKETDETDPVPHRKVSGHFESSEEDFNIYLPPKSLWDGRFFQLVYPTQNSSATDYAIGFGVDSGGYTVQMASFGYRGNAAVAKLSRQIAREYYGEQNTTIHGYIYGGSGGSLQTVGAVENTKDVWNGGIILVQAVPFSNPNNWPIRALSGSVLSEDQNEIIEAVRPGGSGDPFSILPEFKRAVLEESTALGVPLRAWENFEGTGQHRKQLWDVMETLVIPQVKQQDPTYAEDFWQQPGYLGSEESELGDFFRESIVEFEAKVSKVDYDDDQPISISFDSVPAGLNEMPGLEATLPPVDKEGQDETERTFFGLFDSENNSVALPATINATWIAALAPNSTLQVDNRWWLAVHTLHRHQVPTPEFGLYEYDFLRDESGDPIYPQRETLLGPGISQGASGGAIHSGNITSKVILMDNLLDADAFPWHADWYKKQVKASLGDAFDDNFRLYYTDNADHDMAFVSGLRSAQIVDFIGPYEQHLRDLSAWVERGIEPPEGTQYTVVNGQVQVPRSAEERLGIQPVALMLVDGANLTTVKTGKAVQFSVHAEVPRDTGLIVSIQWDFYGNGTYTKMEIEAKASIDIRTEYTYTEAGIYLPSARVTSQRDGDGETAFALVRNLARAQVVVE